jgi:succinoglycan biosynthesis transport protein ExoP
MIRSSKIAGGSAAENDVSGGMDLSVVLLNHQWTVLTVFVAGLLMGALYYFAAPRVYRSTAQILLIKKEAGLPGKPTAGAGRYVAYEDTLSTHTILVRSPLIVEQAIKKHSLGELASLKGNKDLLGAVTHKLEAAKAGTRSSPDPNIMELTFDGSDPADCAKVLEAVIQSYQEYLGATYENISKQAVELLTRAKDDLDHELLAKEAEYRKFRQDATLIGKGRDGVSMQELRVGEIERSRGQAMVELAALRAKVEGVEAAMQRGAKREALALLMTNDRDGKSAEWRWVQLDASLFENMIQEQGLTEKFGPEHPQVKAVERKMELLRTKLGDKTKGGDKAPLDFLAIAFDALREQLSIETEKLAELDQLFEREKVEAKKATLTQLADEQFRTEITRTQQMFEQVIKLLQEINMVKDYSAVTAQVIAAPELGEKVKPTLVLTFGAFGFLGMIAGLGLAFAQEVFERRFRSPEQICHETGLPVIAHVPDFQPQKISRNGKVTVRPVVAHGNRREAEAFRAIRTSLYFSAASKGYKVIQVTSPNVGDGKSTLVANLAVSIADSGKSTLLIDGDLRRPRVHEVFGVSNDEGLCSVIGAQGELSDAIQPSGFSNLSLMACGPRPENPAELLTSPQFKDLLDTLRERFDVILIDSPPLLAVTDPAVIAARADAVLLALRLSKYARDDTIRAVEILRSIGATTLGIVVNVVDGTREGYKNYTYGYRYGYGSSYSRYYSSDEYFKAEKNAGEEPETAPLPISPVPSRNGE